MRNRKKLLILAAALLLLAGGGWFLYSTGFFQAVRSLDALRAYIAGSAPCSHLVFFLVQLLSVVLAPIPSNITAAAGGVLFGTWPAFGMTFAAVACGSLLVFWLARVLGRDFADRLVSRKLSEKYQGVLRAKAPVFLTLAFLFPFFPDDMLCILAGLTSLSFGRFALIVLLTRPWGLLFASALGGSTLGLSPWAMAPIGLLGLAVFLLGMKYGDRVEQAVFSRLKGDKRGKTE
ncbi:MAG: TVP38/TMEM64 family protein [Lawsonibacter sp.]|nr:TVP38/TMEM64 family protein [Lawsonibacter sp.]